jgi:Lrp/AsnC family transcriptional regulator, leucine-responsive regulatory protein
MFKLDKTDLKILALLEVNARQSLSKIAKSIGTSEQVISYRIKTLEDEGVIGEYFTIINFAQLGYTSYRTMIRLSNIDEATQKKIIAYLVSHRNTLWIVDCGGRYDLLVNFLAASVQDYDIMIRKFKNTFSEQIQNCEVLVLVNSIGFGRNYLVPHANPKEWVLQPQKEAQALDDLDLRILDKLAMNARISALSVGTEINCSTNTVIQRIKNMTKHGYIQGYRPLVHLEKTPYRAYKALIKIHNNTEQRERQLVNYLRMDNCVLLVVRLIGSWNFEVQYEVATREEGLKFTRNLRDKFRDIITDFEVLALYHEYKHNFFPGDLLVNSKHSTRQYDTRKTVGHRVL